MPDGKHKDCAGERLPSVKTRSYENLPFIIAPLEALTKPKTLETLDFNFGFFILSAHYTPTEASCNR